jgi:histidinol-phosphate aminotransferase
MYAKIAHFCGMAYQPVALNEDFSLPQARLEEAMAQTQPALVLLASPNNPTGNAVDHDALLAIVENAPGLVAIDEAYLAFSRRPSFVAALDRYDHLLILRTLSKTGLAGLRIGYLVAQHAIAEEMEKLRLPYNLSTLNQEAAAFMLSHAAVLEEQVDNILLEKEKLIVRLQRLGLTVYPSHANFLLVKVPDAPGLFAHLKANRVLVKNFHGEHPLLAQCLRISIGLPEEHAMLLQLIENYLYASRDL